MGGLCSFRRSVEQFQDVLFGLDQVGDNVFMGGIGVAFAEGYVELAMELERRPVHLGVFKHDLEIPRVDVAYEAGQLSQHRVARGFGEDNVELEVQI